MTALLRLKMPYPDTWLRPAVDEYIGCCLHGSGEHGSDSYPAIAAAIIPPIVAATLEAAAELVDSYGDSPPAATGGQWLQMLAEQARAGAAGATADWTATVGLATGAPRALHEVEQERDNLAREVRRLEALVKDRKRAPWWRRMRGVR